MKTLFQLLLDFLQELRFVQITPSPVLRRRRSTHSQHFRGKNFMPDDIFIN